MKHITNTACKETKQTSKNWNNWSVFRTPANIKDEVFAKIVNEFMPLTIFIKTSILDVCRGSKYASECTSSWSNRVN